MSAHGTSRRLVLGAALALPLVWASHASNRAAPRQRQSLVLRRRSEAAAAQFVDAPPREVANGDENRYSDRRASFSKTLPHNELGEVDPSAYRRWLTILASGNAAQFEQVPRDPRAVERLDNPQAAYAVDLVGADATALSLPAPPAFASRAQATEMLELYWLALMRDVPFRSYGADPLAAKASAELRTAGLDVASLFRSRFDGDRRGPFISQFLWLDVPYGLRTIDQRYHVPAPGQDFLTSFDPWLASQRGERATATTRLDPEPCYIANYRALTEYVRRDFSFQAFLNAALIALRMGGDDVWSPTNPYRGSRTQFGDITFGNKNLLSLLAQASLLAQKVSYYWKWQVHRRARPESFGGRIDVHLRRRSFYDIHPAILHSEALDRVKAANGSWLLPLAYPEGSPTHPSYPAAHAVNAGASATVLKAFLDENYEIRQPVQASADGTRLEPWHGEKLLLGGEIDKLASNIALARDAAGVHFRSDSIEGLKLGEAVAIALLADYRRTYNEHFDDFVLTRFNGEKVRIGSSV